MRTKRYRTFNRTLIRNSLLVLTLCAVSGTAVTADTGAGNGVATRVESVARLLQHSSAARIINGSGNDSARDLHAQAVAAHKQARTAYQQGDMAAAEKHLNVATQLMFRAAREADGAAVSQDKQRQDLRRRDESLEALLTAYQRIRKEKSLAKDAALGQQVAQLRARAHDLETQGNIEAARGALDEAYVKTKAAIENQRSGDTLVRRLEFADAADEYRYEIDRNDTHRMLIKVLIGAKPAPGAAPDAGDFIAKADALRAAAERMAGKGEFERAIEKLEASTGQLVRAIRAAGIYIPG